MHVAPIRTGRPAAPASLPMTNARLSGAARGRGTQSNPANRFETAVLEPFDDGWDTLDGLADLPPLPTTLTRDASKSVISWNTSPDIGFDRAVNPYRGCEHGCVYCYARPTHAYLGYSAGLDFETKLVFKPDVGPLLERELRKPGYVCKPIALGSNTDPYQPVERTLKLTRTVLEVLERYGHPVSIVTKSAGVLRDIDILQRMAARGLVRVYLSVTTLDAALARRMEPRAATPERRLAAIAALSQAGVPAAVLAAPMIPGLNDAELEAILERASRAGARFAGYVLLRLPHELRRDVRDLARRALPGPRAPCAEPDTRHPRRRAERQQFRGAFHRPGAVCGIARQKVRAGGAAMGVRGPDGAGDAAFQRAGSGEDCGPATFSVLGS